MLFAEDALDWRTIITAAVGALILLMGAFGKTFNDIISTWFKVKSEARKAEAQIKLEEARVRGEQEAGQITQWKDLYGSLRQEYGSCRKDLDQAKTQIANADTLIDELQEQVGEMRSEHAQCQAHLVDLHHFCVQAASALQRHGEKVEAPAAPERLTPERRARRDQRDRQTAQSATAVKAVAKDILSQPTQQPRPEKEGGQPCAS